MGATHEESRWSPCPQLNMQVWKHSTIKDMRTATGKMLRVAMAQTGLPASWTMGRAAMTPMKSWHPVVLVRSPSPSSAPGPLQRIPPRCTCREAQEAAQTEAAVDVNHGQAVLMPTTLRSEVLVGSTVILCCAWAAEQ